ncbi:MAG: ATPase with chaperone activity [Betaproteobacteria bacterium]|nr:ATPase with chaperone activity [Betaproteobacteria bacterium]
MPSESQFEIPPSFIALYVEPGRLKPHAPREVIAARYEFCEDLASMLTEHAAEIKGDLKVTEEDVLVRIHRGLLAQASGVDPKEAQWVITRLAELLNWPRLASSGEPGA